MIENIKVKIYNLLRQSQKYTGTDNVYLAKGGFWLTLGQVITTGASFLLAVAFANLIDPTTYGNYKYILSLVGILGIFSLPGIGTAIIQATARNLEGSFYTGFKTKLKWGLLGSLAAVGLAGYYFLRGNYLLPIPLLISAVFLPLMQASSVYANLLVGRKLFSIKIKYNSIIQILSVIAMIAALFLTKNLFWLIAAYFFSHTFLNFFFYWLARKKFQPNKKEDPQTISYGKHLSVMNLIGLIASQLDKVLLFTLVGAAPLAIYYFALALPDQVRGFSRNLFSLALPKLSARPTQEIKSNMKRRSLQLLFFSSVIVFVYVVSAPYIYKIFFPQYLESIFYSQIYMFSLLTLPVGLMSIAFQAKAKKKELYLLQLTPFIQIILLVGLIPVWGIIGALIAILTTKVIGIALTLALFRKF